MTAQDFRNIALSLPGASEAARMGHPDFRVGGRIFATLGYPRSGWGMIALTPEQQELFVGTQPWRPHGATGPPNASRSRFQETLNEEVRMTPLFALWLPILLSAVIVFVVSSLIHMVSPWHKGDYPKIPNEDRVRDMLRPLAIPPGDYMVPRPSSRQEMSSPAFAEKVKQGPNMIVTILPSGPWPMAKPLTLWFVYAVAVGVFAAYVAGRALPPGAQYPQVFRFVGTTAFIGYAVALWQMSIWYRRAWSTTLKGTVDGLIYALLTAGTFGWLWPS